MFQRVLVPLDGSDESLSILPYVSSLARGLNIPVVVMSVVDPGTPGSAHEITSPGVVRYEERLPFMSFAADERYYVPTQPHTPVGDALPGRTRRQEGYLYVDIDDSMVVGVTQLRARPTVE